MMDLQSILPLTIYFTIYNRLHFFIEITIPIPINWFDLRLELNFTFFVPWFFPIFYPEWNTALIPSIDVR